MKNYKGVSVISAVIDELNLLNELDYKHMMQIKERNEIERQIKLNRLKESEKLLYSNVMIYEVKLTNDILSNIDIRNFDSFNNHVQNRYNKFTENVLQITCEMLSINIAGLSLSNLRMNDNTFNVIRFKNEIILRLYSSFSIDNQCFTHFKVEAFKNSYFTDDKMQNLLNQFNSIKV